MTGLRRYALGSAAAVAVATCLAGSALADGMKGGRVGYDRPWSWSGFYIGGHLGGGWADADWIHDQPAATEPINANPSGVVGGGQLGFLHQWGPWVGGVEVSYSAADLNETVESAVINNRSRSVDINDIFLAGVRLGYAADRSLFYVKGGYANADVDISSHRISNGQLTSSSSKRESGWNLGAGWEYAIKSNVILGVQYDFISLDGSDRFDTQRPGFATTDHREVDIDIHTVTARLSFKFDRDREPVRPLK
jgi:outer membrane immunogenic protein